MFASVKTDSEPMEILPNSEAEEILTCNNPEAETIKTLNQIVESLEHEIEESSDEETQTPEGNDIIDKTVEEAAEVADWVEGVLEDAAPKSPCELEALAQAGLQKARKGHDYRSEVTFAGLVDFYRWMPRLGRLRSAMRVARNLQRGPAFA